MPIYRCIHDPKWVQYPYAFRLGPRDGTEGHERALWDAMLATSDAARTWCSDQFEDHKKAHKKDQTRRWTHWSNDIFIRGERDAAAFKLRWC